MKPMTAATLPSDARPPSNKHDENAGRTLWQSPDAEARKTPTMDRPLDARSHDDDADDGWPERRDALCGGLGPKAGADGGCRHRRAAKLMTVKESTRWFRMLVSS